MLIKLHIMTFTGRFCNYTCFLITDINECNDPGTHPCYGDCKNTPGSYNCTCPSGSFGDAKIENGCQHPNNSKSPSSIFIIGNIS
ncbi:putative EGF-like calcium-binding domain-containing protein [Helianthus anomalus]